MTLSSKIFLGFIAIALATTLAGCASYRTDSNLPSEAPIATDSKTTVVILENTPHTKFKELGPIEISLKTLTVFHKKPTKEQANAALIEKARALGADAVVKVTYKSGGGLTTLGYIDAQGTAVKFVP